MTDNMGYGCAIYGHGSFCFQARLSFVCYSLAYDGRFPQSFPLFPQLWLSFVSTCIYTHDSLFTVFFSPFVCTAPAPLCNIVAALVQVLNIVGHAVQTIIFLPVARSHIFCSWWLPAAPLSVKVCTAVATPVAQWWHSHHSVKTRECDRTRARHHSSQVGVVSTRATRQ